MSLSVVIPMFNGEPFILRTLLSVACQTMAPREVLLVDDGSTDTSLDVLKALRSGRYLDSDPSSPLKRLANSLRVIQQRNSGPGAARNTGLVEATSDWVAFLDADDLWYPDHLQEIQSLIDMFPDARLVGTSYRHRDFRSLQDEMPMRTPQAKSRILIDYFARASKDVGIICSSAVAAHRESVILAGGFGSWSAGEDLELWANLALKYPVAHSTKTTAVYVRHSGSQMATLEVKNSSELPIESLADLSPSSQLVAHALETGEHSVSTNSLRLYLNSRLTSTLRTLLIHGEADHAKRLSILALRPRPPLVLFMIVTPVWLLKLLRRLWSLKRFLHQ